MEDFFRISQQVSTSPLIDSVGNNFILKVGAFPNDPLIPMQYGFGPADSTAFVLGQSGYAVTQQSPEANLRADLAWESKRDCSTISVGVIDSGIDANYPDLNQNLDLANSRNFVPDALLNDDCSQNSVAIPNGGNSIAPAKYVDENGHGTHVAGTIGALGNNGVGVSGVCWNAKIITIRTMNRCGRGSSASIISGINYAAENKIRVVNMSLGGDVSEFVLSPNSAEYRSIAAVGAAGGLVIAAAGNESTDNSVAFKFPASINHPALVSVASHNALNQISEFSNFSANNVHIAAPGEGIVSTIPLAVRSGLAQLINNSDVANLPAAEKFKEAAMTFPQRGYDLKDGTSMAAPHVAGVAALVWSMDPTRSNLEVKELLYETADKVQEFQSRVVEGRRVNLGRALSAAEGLSVRLRAEAGGGRVSASVASSEPIYVRLDGEQVIRFSEGELYLGSEKVGQCSAFDGTCVGRISNSLNQTSSDVLSVKKGSQTISVGIVRVIPLSDGNGVFKSGNANFSCRLLEQGKVVASFKAASDEACSNVCRVLSSKVLDGSSVCSFAGKTENINAGACNVPVE
jgi:subtilisin family serine protease